MTANSTQQSKAEHLAQTNHPPKHGYTWTVTVPHPVTAKMSVPLRGGGKVSDEEIDRWAENLPWPAGWETVSTVQCSRPAGGRPARGHIHPEDHRVVRVKLYHPGVEPHDDPDCC